MLEYTGGSGLYPIHGCPKPTFYIGNVQGVDVAFEHKFRFEPLALELDLHVSIARYGRLDVDDIHLYVCHEQIRIFPPRLWFHVVENRPEPPEKSPMNEGCFPGNRTATYLLACLVWSGGLWAQTADIERVLERAEKNIQTNYQRAIDQADSVLTRDQDAQTTSRALKIRASASLYSGDYRSAMADFQKMYSLHLAEGDTLEASKSMNNMGLVRKTQGHYEQAMEHFFKALELRGKNAGKEQTAGIHINIAATFAVQENYPKARIYYSKALEGIKLKKDSNAEHQLYLDLAGLELADGNLDQCSTWLDKAFEFWEASPIQSELARAWYIRGNYRLERREFAGAQQAYTEALAIYERIGNRAQVAGCRLRLAQVSRSLGRPEEALHTALEALKTAQSIGSLNIQSRTHLELSLIYAELKDFEKALEQRLQFEQFNDSLVDADSKARIGELEERYQNEQKDRKMAELLAENRAQQLGLKNQEIKLWGLMSLLFIGSILGVSLWFQSRQRLKNQKSLEDKNAQIERSLEEKEILLREVHHRVKNHLQFVSSLLSLQLRHLPKGEAYDALGEAAGRIRSLSLVHESLYRGEAITEVRIDEYLKGLVESMVHAFGLSPEAADLSLSLEALSLDIERAIPLGLIVNEWVTNAFKHGKDAQGKLSLSLSLQLIDHRIELSVADRGLGFEPKSPEHASNGMGLKLVEQLLEKLSAVATTKQGSTGTKHHLSMPISGFDLR